MASKKSLTFDIFGRDRSASKTMRGVGSTADRLGKTMRRVGAGIGVGLAVAGAAAFKFGSDSVKAFSEAQESQNKLAFAFTKFPKLADTNQKALQKLNTELQKKTRFDDDLIAVGQAQLAQYKLTGAQIKRLTPLMLDYAARTGKDLPTAAKDLGKALLGQGRALKEVGIEFKDAGSVGANFDQLMKDLSVSVGGFAQKDATTAAGKLENLKNRFGDFQETIGGALMPVLVELMDVFEKDVMPGLEEFGGWFAEDGITGIKGAFDWITKYKDILGPAAGALGVLTAAQWVLNAAMSANPVGLVIMGLGLLVGLGVLVATNWNAISKAVYSTTGGLVKGLVAIGGGIAKALGGVFNFLIDGANRAVDIVNPVLKFLGLAQLKKSPNANFDKAIDNFLANFNTLVAQGSRGGLSTVGSRGGGSNVRAFATGGIVRATPGGTQGVIGEGGNDEAVIPLSKQALAKYGLGGGGDTYVIQVPGGFVGSENQLAQAIERVMSNAKKRGAVRGGVFA